MIVNVHVTGGWCSQWQYCSKAYNHTVTYALNCCMCDCVVLCDAVFDTLRILYPVVMKLGIRVLNLAALVAGLVASGTLFLSSVADFWLYTSEPTLVRSRSHSFISYHVTRTSFIQCNCHLQLSHYLTYKPPPYSNGPAFVLMCQTLRLCAMSFVTLYHFMSSLMLSNHIFLGLPSSLSLYWYV